MVACLLIPKFELLASCPEGRRILRIPAALAPESGRTQAIGEASPAAEVYGIHRGMQLGEALARYPALELIPPDPIAMSDLWERALEALAEIGAAVQPGPPGEAHFAVEGLFGLYGDLDRVIEAAHGAVGEAARPAVASGPFAARMAAEAEGAPGTRSLTERGRNGAHYRFVSPDRTGSFLSPLPVSSLLHGLGERDDGPAAETLVLIRDLERLGLKTLGALAALEPGKVTERFGRTGLKARRLARGEPEPLRPRPSEERLEEYLELPDSLDGVLLPKALELLIDRLLSRPERRGRAIRALTLSAVLSGGGSRRIEAALNTPTASPEPIALVLIPKLSELPGPVSALGIGVREMTGEDGDRPRLVTEAGEARRDRLGEAVRRVRTTAGPDSLLRVLALDPESRLPERRAALSPHTTESTRWNQL